MDNTKSVYVLLIRTNTIVSRLIHFFTKCEYTHSSIGMSSDCHELYSFARKYMISPIPACFVRENIDTGVMAKFPNSPCALYEIKIPKQVFDKIYNELETLKHLDKPLKYSLLGPIFCWIGYESKQRKKFFCSRFVADLLERSGAVTLSKPAALFRPIDFTSLSELKLIYRGTLGELADKNADVAKIA